MRALPVRVSTGCMCVDSRECGYREFGGPYINQFHYHRDQGVSEFPLRATPRDLGGEWEYGFVSSGVRFRSRDFSLRDKTRRRGIGSDSRSRSHLQSSPGTPKKTPIVGNFRTAVRNYFHAVSSTFRRIHRPKSWTLLIPADSNGSIQMSIAIAKLSPSTPKTFALKSYTDKTYRYVSSVRF